jgi:hypothetical protein
MACPLAFPCHRHQEVPCRCRACILACLLLLPPNAVLDPAPSCLQVLLHQGMEELLATAGDEGPGAANSWPRWAGWNLWAVVCLAAGWCRSLDCAGHCSALVLSFSAHITSCPSEQCSLQQHSSIRAH